MTSRIVTVEVDAEDLRLLERDARALVESNEYPRGTLDADQPTDWHQGHRLLRLAQRLKRAFKKSRRRALA